MERGVDWMFSLIKHAAGIHMSSYKKDDAEEAAENTSAEEGDMDLSGWTPPPSFIATVRESMVKGGAT